MVGRCAWAIRGGRGKPPSTYNDADWDLLSEATNSAVESDKALADFGLQRWVDASREGAGSEKSESRVIQTQKRARQRSKAAHAQLQSALQHTGGALALWQESVAADEQVKAWSPQANQVAQDLVQAVEHLTAIVELMRQVRTEGRYIPGAGGLRR